MHKNPAASCQVGSWIKGCSSTSRIGHSQSAAIAAIKLLNPTEEQPFLAKDLPTPESPFRIPQGM